MSSKAVRGTVIAALALSPLTPATAAQPDLARFSVGGTQIAIPYPKGYCPPTDIEAFVLAKLSQGDPGNAFGTSFHQCDHRMEAGKANDYTVIVAPRVYLLRQVEFAQLVKEMGPTFEGGVAFDARGMMRQSSDALGKALGAPVNLEGSIRPFGHDDTCLYIGGVVTYRIDSGSYSQAMGSCTTTVSGRVLTIYRFGKQLDTAGVALIMREAKAIALTARALDQI